MTSEMVPQGKDIAQVFAGPEGDVLRRALEGLVRQLMEAEVTARVGAGLHERSDERTTWRNGYRPRGWETRVGPLLLQGRRRRRSLGPSSFGRTKPPPPLPGKRSRSDLRDGTPSGSHRPASATRRARTASGDRKWEPGDRQRP